MKTTLVNPPTFFTRYLTCLLVMMGTLSPLAATQPASAANFSTLRSQQPPTAKRAIYLPLVDGGKVAISLVAGNSHTCALSDGAVACWGLNDSGQIGDGTREERHSPVAVSDLEGEVTAITAGFDHTCAVVNGGVRCWGSNTYGELGDGSNAARSTPVAVEGLESGVRAVAAGYFHSCAAPSAGGVMCWGNNLRGRLGDGTPADSLTPVAVVGLNGPVKALVAGWAHTCALMAAGGAVACWGGNGSGQLGDGSIVDRTTAVAVVGLSGEAIALSAGDSHTCALIKGGRVQCWGYNGSGQLGDGTTANSPIPVTVTRLDSAIMAIASSYGHSCALLQSGAVRCWGFNENGQLGDGTVDYRTAPVEVAGTGAGVSALGLGWGHTCVLGKDAGKCWGINFNGQLGDGTITFRPSPTDILFE